MRKILLILLTVMSFCSAEASHVTGGEIIYEYLRPGVAPNSKVYRITLLLFRDGNCVDCAPMPASAYIGIYPKTSSFMFRRVSVLLDRRENVPVAPLYRCMMNPPELNYQVGYYPFEIELPQHAQGYDISFQTCCRSGSLNNVYTNPDPALGNGATYSVTIPGTYITKPDSSPRFKNEVAIICADRPFTYDFSATDPDASNDSLFYFFCNAQDGGLARNENFPNPGRPPYSPVPYTGPFSGSSPMGPDVHIDSRTGIISGVAPAAGKYIVTVCVYSFDRSYAPQRLITIGRKDMIITVAPCDIASASLPPEYIICDAAMSISPQNVNPSPLNETFYWDFGDGNISTEQFPTHNYSTPGIYNIKLVVNRDDARCADSATSVVKLYPGFTVGMDFISPTCKNTPVQFTDMSTTNGYGSVNSWKWDFGDLFATGSNTSTLQNPLYTGYARPFNYTVSLTATSDRGCKATITKDITILESAPYTLTNDTLICNIDTIRLDFITPNPGTVTWTPNYMISNTSSYTPLVSPDVTTKYYVSYADNFNCTVFDSVLVRVVDRVTISTRTDTTICRTDSLVLTTNSDGLLYTWTPPATLNNATLQSPVAIPVAAVTEYHVLSTIGKCTGRDTVIIRTAPYPAANAGPDSTICIGASLQLNASGGSVYNWTPRIFLNNSNIPNPVAQSPQNSIDYIVTVRDVLGCPKPVSDTMRLTVAKIVADAGPADTNVVLGQPLLLNGTGSINYQWTPSTWLNNPAIFNPISLPQESVQYVLRVSNAQGCFDTDTINVKLFKIDPDLLVPSAFSPDNDGVNDIFRPIVIGMKSLDVFKVYNRWGQLMFSTARPGDGWDGYFKGAPQGAGTYVWFASGVTYLGRKVEKKGSVVLIR